MKLRQTWQRVRTVPGLGRDVLAVGLVIALGLVSGGIILSHLNMHAPWSDRYSFAADFDQAPAISPGNNQEVRIAGVRVGEITSASVTRDGHARVEMALDPGHTIYDNAELVLRPKNPLNEMYIEVNPGGPPGKPLPANGVIPLSRTQRPVQPDEVFDHLDDRSRNALTTLLSESDIALANAPQTLPGGLQATDGTLVKLQPVVQALRTRQDTVRQLVTAFSQIATSVGGDDQRLGQMIDSTQQTLTALAGRQDDLSKSLADLPGFATDLKNAMDGVGNLTTQLNPTLDDLNKASSDLPPALQRMTSTVGQLGQTVQQARPVVQEAQPVVADLRPVVDNLDASMTALRPTTMRLDEMTSKIVGVLDGGLQGFVYNTNSVFSVRDNTGVFPRGNFGVQVDTLGTGYVPDQVPDWAKNRQGGN
ncbi:MCE family protein [Amycolatopsis acidicola]|uniref:MCE family protein n=1 Tax=Amycolatopsis acidicola TaxID=2596893 RepID=A0A5N0USI4_9PSEU|nr:MlaD family protein [Amycolatopsis acidicola]KAA9153981.1 MCE family protein [Amycolatopsis acidicola]